MKDLPYEISGWMLEGNSGSKWEKSRFKGGKGDYSSSRKTNNTVISTDFSALTLNTGISGKTVKARPCTDCGLFHPEYNTKDCPFYDPVKKLFKVNAFIGHRTVRQIHGDGSSSPNEYWMSKLRQFSFPAMGITRDEDKQKIIKDIKTAISQLPEASVEERRKYKDENKRFINMAKIEYEGLQPVKVMAAVSSAPKTMSKAARKNKARRERKKKKEEEEDSSDGPDSDHSSDIDSYGSDEGHRY